MRQATGLYKWTGFKTRYFFYHKRGKRMARTPRWSTTQMDIRNTRGTIDALRAFKEIIGNLFFIARNAKY